MRRYILAVTLCFCLLQAQFPPQWGTIECDASLSDRFLPTTRYTYYDRYYTFTAEYATDIRRDVKISTCIEQSPYTVLAFFETTGGDAFLRPIENPTDQTRQSYDGYSCDESGETGRTFLFHDVPAGDYEVGIFNSDTDGGRYKFSVECIEPSTPAPNELKSNNITTKLDLTYRQEWNRGGQKKISCNANAFGLMSDGTNGPLRDWYQYTVTDYAQEIVFTTCYPETAFDDPGSFYNGVSMVDHYLQFEYWDFGTTSGTRWWRTQTENSWSGSCETMVIGDAYDTGSTNILKLSPGTYYIGVGRYSNNTASSYVLSMLCWDNDAVEDAVAGTDYDEATFNPTQSPNTFAPTPSPTDGVNTTLNPTTYPTVKFDGPYDNTGRTLNKGTISCGIHQHDKLAKKYSHYYTFEVLTTTRVYFDTCMADFTSWDSCTHIHEYNSGSNNWDVVASDCSYCNIISSSLSAGLYYVEIYGENKEEDYGEYILRMGCGYGEDAQVTAVDSTAAPTPAPTGIADIPAKDGRVVGDIACGLTVSGKTSSMRGDFHKFTVVGGGIEWVKFDTCEATSFENYLFVYDYWNQTGVEFWNYDSFNSIGFHYEDDTTCNEITMNDLPPGVYYVNIDGFNYYFDHGEYTITMSCSDGSKIAGASNYNEYKEPFPWWAILLIVVFGAICLCGVVFAICYMKKKKNGDVSGVSKTEMQETGDGE